MHICPLPFRTAYFIGLPVSKIKARVSGIFAVSSKIHPSHSSYWLQKVTGRSVIICKQAWSYRNVVPLQFRINEPTFSKLSDNIFWRYPTSASRKLLLKFNLTTMQLQSRKTNCELLRVKLKCQSRDSSLNEWQDWFLFVIVDTRILTNKL